MFKAFLIVSIVYLLLSFITIVLAWFLRVRRWYFLWLISSLAGSCLGILLAQAGSAMSSSQNSAMAGFKGAVFGFLLGLFYSGISLGIIRLFRSKKN